jgi:hypothetical protein
MRQKQTDFRSSRLAQWLLAWRKANGPRQLRKTACRPGTAVIAEILCLESRALLSGPTVTQSVASVAANATTLTIAGTGFDTTAAHNSVVVKDTVTGTSITVTPTTVTATSMTVSLTGIGTLTGGDHLTAVVTTNSVSSGSAVQVGTVIPVVTLSKVAATSPTVTINGFGFDPVIAHDVLTLTNNGVAISGTITAATATSLTVTINSPVNAGTLSAVVKVNGASSGAAIQVAAIQPVVTVNTAKLPAGANSILISGFGFDPNHAQNSVAFNNGAVGIVTAWTQNSITVTFQVKPKTPGALTVVVTSRHLSSGTPVQVATV